MRDRFSLEEGGLAIARNTVFFAENVGKRRYFYQKYLTNQMRYGKINDTEENKSRYKSVIRTDVSTNHR